MRRFVLCFGAVLALSCGNTARPDFVVHLVDAANGNPFAHCDSGTVRVDVQQSTNAVLTSNATITGTGMISSLSVEIPSYGLTTQIGVTVSCTGGAGRVTLIGSTPHFIPVGYGFVNVVLGEPRSCAVLSSPSLVSSRVGVQLVSLHANLIALGGLEGTDASPSTHVQALDPVTLTFNQAASEFARLSIGIGLGHAVPLGDTHVAFASDSLTGVYDAGAATTGTARLTTLSHSGGSDAAVASLNGNGVAIVGGAIGGDAISDITWIAADGASSSSGQLMFPRRRPAAVWIGNQLLVVGGQGPGEPLFELVHLLGDGTAFGPTTEQRFAPIVTANREHSRAFVALGSTAVDGGTILGSTWTLSSCAANSCMVAAGPAFGDARSDVSLVEHIVGPDPTTTQTDDYEALLIGGTDTSATPMASTLIDRVHFESDGSVTVSPAGNLHTPRALAGAAEIGGGVVIVAGGRDDRGDAQQTLEICFPAALRPVGPE